MLSGHKFSEKTGLLSCCKGTAAVEFAIVLPLTLLLLFGVFEIGRLLTDFQTITKSVRDASRFLARVEMTCPGTGPSTGPVQNYLVDVGKEAIAKNLVLGGTVVTPTAAGDFLVKTWTDFSTVAASVACVANAGQYEGVYTNQALIPVVTVTATVPFNFLWGTIFINRASLSMIITHSEVHVGE